MTQGLAPLIWVGSQQTFDDPPKGFWVAVPVVLHRIIVEVLPDIPDSDPFARVVVNLAAAGVQRVADIADLIGIEDLGFVNEVIRRLSEQNVVKLRAGVVQLMARSDDIIESATEKVIWYGIQEVYGGSLWPRAASSVLRPEFDDSRRIVELGTPGRPASRNFWQLPANYTVDEPDVSSVRQAIERHLSDLRTVGLKSTRNSAQHLAMMGRPEKIPTFSARLAPIREDARLLVRFESIGGQISVVDPFEVGAWFELAHWSEQLLARSQDLRDRVISWEERSSSRNRSLNHRGLDDGHRSGGGSPLPLDATLTRSAKPTLTLDRNSLLLSLADRLRDEIRRATQQELGLSYDSERDSATLRRRWAVLGFNLPRQSVIPVASLIRRAADGAPSDLHTLFYAWTLLADLSDGQALALQAPDLPALLYENACGRSQTVIPDLRGQGSQTQILTTESGY